MADIILEILQNKCRTLQLLVQHFLAFGFSANKQVWKVNISQQIVFPDFSKQNFQHFNSQVLFRNFINKLSNNNQKNPFFQEAVGFKSFFISIKKF
jgi:hypothetical protein